MANNQSGKRSNLMFFFIMAIVGAIAYGIDSLYIDAELREAVPMIAIIDAFNGGEDQDVEETPPTECRLNLYYSDNEPIGILAAAVGLILGYLLSRQLPSHRYTPFIIALTWAMSWHLAVDWQGKPNRDVILGLIIFGVGHIAAFWKFDYENWYELGLKTVIGSSAISFVLVASFFIAFLGLFAFPLLAGSVSGSVPINTAVSSEACLCCSGPVDLSRAFRLMNTIIGAGHIAVASIGIRSVLNQVLT